MLQSNVEVLGEKELKIGEEGGGREVTKNHSSYCA